MIQLISRHNRVQADGPLTGAAIDTPPHDASLPGYGVELAGWAVAASGSVERIEILHQHEVVRTTVLSEPRPDVGRVFHRSAEELVGFRTRVNLLGLPLQVTLRVAAIVDGTPVEIGELSLRRDPLRVRLPPDIHPLVVTTMGRTGSVWLSRLVGEHPAIVSYRPFESEPRMGSYWAHVLRALADPASIVQGLAPVEMNEQWWLGQQDQVAIPQVPERAILDWLARDHPEQTARFCLESASDFYARVAAVQQKTEVVYYAEKYLPSFVPSMLLELDAYAKEIFLVRDPRDQLASVVSWTSAGRAQFSPDAKTAEEYVDWLAPRTKDLLRHWHLRSARSLLVRYEDLVLEPAATLARLFDYLDVDSSPATVAEVLAKAHRATPKLQRQHQTSASAEQSIGRWRDDISPSVWPRLDEVFAAELESWYPSVLSEREADAAEAVPEASASRS